MAEETDGEVAIRLVREWRRWFDENGEMLVFLPTEQRASEDEEALDLFETSVRLIERIDQIPDWKVGDRVRVQGHRFTGPTGRMAEGEIKVKNVDGTFFVKMDDGYSWEYRRSELQKPAEDAENTGI